MHYGRLCQFRSMAIPARFRLWAMQCFTFFPCFLLDRFALLGGMKDDEVSTLKALFQIP